jgi:hypothetical protein
MSHFAKLDDNNVVLEVNALSNHELVTSKNTVDEDGNVVVSLVESEDKGIAFLTAWSGGHTNWKQTSYNATFRGKLAAIGDTYDPVTNLFVAPVVVQQEVPEGLPTMDLTVLETQPEAAITSQAVVDLSSTDLPALNSSDVAALTSEQITGL